MKNVKEIIDKDFQAQKVFFFNENTRSLDFRLSQLKKLRAAIKKYESQIYKALWEDLHKSEEEAYFTEITIVLQELDFHIHSLKKWMKPRKVKTPFFLFPSKSKIQYEPLGIALIIAPWNYPFQLLINPLIGALSSGCCAYLKPSPYAKATAFVLEKMIREIFPPHYVSIVMGDKEVYSYLLKLPFNFFFFTGSSSSGKEVMKAASEHLVPVVLELGGKSPCIVDRDSDLEKAAMRIMWGKTLNSGQTCIAPDYLWVHRDVKSNLMNKMEEALQKMYGGSCRESCFYGRMISNEAVVRLQNFLKSGRILLGGEIDEKEKYFSPTVIDSVLPEDPVMQEEIFGPVLPIMEFTDLEEAIHFIHLHEKPLACYYFGNKKTGKRLSTQVNCGAFCINDTVVHAANHHLPFGGVGNSGMGKYHGKESFKVFSHRKAIIETPNFPNIQLKYPPYLFFKRIRKWMG